MVAQPCMGTCFPAHARPGLAISSKMQGQQICFAVDRRAQLAPTGMTYSENATSASTGQRGACTWALAARRPSVRGHVAQAT